MDGFLAVFSPDGSDLLCSTDVGGSGNEYLRQTHALAVDPQGYAYILCSTSSPDFPVTDEAVGRTFGEVVDMAVTKIDASTGAIVLATYLGGTRPETPDGISVDSIGSVFVSGETESDAFPVTADGFQTTKGAGVDAVFVRLSHDFRSLLCGTLMGGVADDKFRASFLADDRTVLAVGTSSGTGFPVRSADQPSYAGPSTQGDVVVVKFRPGSGARAAGVR